MLFCSLSLRLHTHGSLAKCLMHMAHKVETLQECRSHRRIGWIIQDVCVAFFNVLPGKKDVVMPNPPHEEKKPSCLQLWWRTLSGSTKPWILKSMWNISSSRHRIFKIHLSFTHRSCYCGDISTPRNVTLNKTNCDWLFDMSVKRPHGRDLANESCMDSRPSAVSLKVWLRETIIFVHIFLV